MTMTCLADLYDGQTGRKITQLQMSSFSQNYGSPFGGVAILRVTVLVEGGHVRFSYCERQPCRGF